MQQREHTPFPSSSAILGFGDTAPALPRCRQQSRSMMRSGRILTSTKCTAMSNDNVQYAQQTDDQSIYNCSSCYGSLSPADLSLRARSSSENRKVADTANALLPPSLPPLALAIHGSALPTAPPDTFGWQPALLVRQLRPCHPSMIRPIRYSSPISLLHHQLDRLLQSILIVILPSRAV